MGTYGLEGVISAWKTGKLTTEQAVGQILLLLQDLEGRVQELERPSGPPRSANTAPKPKDTL
jgi:hypothetical protein